MKYGIALFAVAGLAAAANAQATNVVFEASSDNGATWGAAREVSPGATVLVRARIQLSGSTSLGLAGITFQPRVTNWSAGDVRNAFTFPGLDGAGAPTSETAYNGQHVPGGTATNTGRIFPFGSSGQTPTSASGLLTSFVDGGNTLRFAGSKNTTAATNAAWGVSSSQLTQNLGGTNFNTSLDVVVFRFSITVDAANTADRHLLATLPSGATPDVNLGRASWYMTANGLNSLNANIGTITPADIHVLVPAPGALALLGLGGLIAGRRRR